MTDQLSSWLTDTFVYTGLLIAFVLLVRRPVSRHFGPQVTYALWGLPLLRFALPPLVLPAWMAPAEQSVAFGGESGPEPVMILISDASLASAARPAGTGLSYMDVLLPLWLGGAALFLFWRARSYLTMRRELLGDGRPVGEAGSVRLIESPAVTSPVAFGVRDKVVALPPFFMAYHDREARDMAIAHELAHHRGGDLLANIVAQPLLALHWFNPLAWIGWRAMRRDQEAACDARVVAGRGRAERVLYASVIAGFAAGDNRLALAAPMACPVLGEKSIIHRLRSLATGEVPTSKRRAGLAAIGAVALGLPLTASISYAAPDPALPSAPHIHGAHPAPAMAMFPAQADLPLASHPQAHSPRQAAGDDHVQAHGEQTARRDHGASDWDHAEAEEHWEAQFEHSMERFEDEMDAQEAAYETLEEAMADREEALSEAHADAEEARADALAHEAHRSEAHGAETHRAEALAEAARRSVPQVISSDSCKGEEPVIERDLGDGRRQIVICNDAINAKAVRGLREARRDIAGQEGLSPERRALILRQIDRQLERMSARRISASISFEAPPAMQAAFAIGYDVPFTASAAQRDECAAPAIIV